MPFCWVIWKKCLWPTLTSLQMFIGTTIVDTRISRMYSTSVHSFVSSAVVNRGYSSFHPRRKSRQSGGQWWNVKRNAIYHHNKKKVAVSLGKQGRTVTDPPLVVHLRENFRCKKSQIESFRFLWPCIVSKLWSERENQQDATVRCSLSILSQHVSGIIMPIFRRTRSVLLHVVCCVGSAGCGW